MPKLSLTKIVATVGPASETTAFLRQAHHDGLAVVRFNFSHGDHAEHKLRIDRIQQLNQRPWRPIGMMLDTKGPELRIGRFKTPAVMVKAGVMITVWTGLDKYQHYRAGQQEMTISFDVSPHITPATKILVDDGKLELEVMSVDVQQQQLIVRAMNDHTLIANKRVNIPGVDFNLPFMSTRDQSDIAFGLQHGVNFIALSFVGKATDVIMARELCAKHDRSDVQLISKIESQTGIDHLDEIIRVSDGVMVARGDLGLEIPFPQLPFWQQQIIIKCWLANKVVIVATQMLDSMILKPLPTRAEINDVYTATTALVDATMLSAETANGKFPALAIQTMHQISEEAELHLPVEPLSTRPIIDLSQATWKSALELMVRQWTNYRPRWVVTETDSLVLARTLSGMRWSVPVLFFTTDRRLAASTSLWRGIFAFVGPVSYDVARHSIAFPAPLMAVCPINAGDKVFFVNRAGQLHQLHVATRPSSVMA